MSPMEFNQERPINSAKEDLLNRRDFVASLAKAISGWQGKESLVIALYGPWGSGKSSIKNMMLESFREAPDQAPAVIEFNPWQWAGQGRIAEAFFSEIQIALGKPNQEKASKEASRKLKYYASYFKMGTFFVESFNNALPPLLILISVLGLGALIPGQIFKTVQATFGILAVAALVAFKWSEGFSHSLAALFDAKREYMQKSPSEMKSDLTGLLMKRQKPLLVVMDDVDRLFPEDVKLLFQIIKSNADFPNMVYLLLFQRDIVENSLAKLLLDDDNGKGFLEKIVQVGIDVPRGDRRCLENVLFSGLNKELADETVSKRFTEDRWANIFIPGIRPYFKTLRDVYRFLSSFSFHVALFKKGTTFEANPIDLIALEVLRVFESEVYRGLLDLKDVMTEGRDRHESLAEKRKQKVEALVAKAPKDHKEQVQELLKKLFPPAEWIFGGHGYGDGYSTAWLQDLRVCAPEMFDKYFILTTPLGDIAQAEVEDLLAYTDNRAVFMEKMRSLNQRGLLDVLLDRLDEAYKETIDLRHANSFIPALIDIGDELPEKRVPGMMEIGSDMKISRIIHWYLMREKDMEKRGQIFIDAVKASVGVYLPIKKTSIEDDKKEREREPHTFLLSERHVEELKKLCVEKIKFADQGGSLRSHPRLGYILYWWRQWAGDEEPRKWVANLITQREGVFQLIAGFIQVSTSQGFDSYAVKVKKYIQLKNIEPFISVQDLETAVLAIPSASLSEAEKLLVETFSKAVARKKQGKPEGDFFRDDD